MGLLIGQFMGLEPLLLESLKLVGIRLLYFIEQLVDALLALDLMPEAPASELMEADVVPT